MSVKILLLIMLAAVFHATWNILLKKCDHQKTVSWLQLVFASIWLIPFLLFGHIHFSMDILPVIALSGIIQACYYYLLSYCYHLGNITTVYPLVRGSAPVFVCIFSNLLGIEHLSLFTFLCLFLIVLGIYIVNMRAFKVSEFIAPFQMILKDKSLRIACLVGVIIAFYTMLDNYSVQYASPLFIYYIVTITPAIIMTPEIIRAGDIKNTIHSCGLFRIFFISLLTFLAYYFVLLAMQNTSASYVSAIREISIVFVIIYSSIRDKDTSWFLKLAGAILIFTGVLLVSITK